jgi:preprotein translocase subunit YajC
MYATVTEVDGDDVVLEVAPGVEVRYLRRAIMEVVQPAEETETYDDAEPSDYHEDDQDEPADGTAEDSDDVKSAGDGLTDSHDDLAKSDKDNVH